MKIIGGDVMMVKSNSLLTDEMKRLAESASTNIRKIEQQPNNEEKSAPPPDLGRSVFSNQVSAAKADLKMGNAIDVRL